MPTTPQPPFLSVQGVDKTYAGTVRALIDVSLDVNEGEIVCLLGPSGCGKSTLLRVVAGLETPDRGRILFQGRDLAAVPVHRRGFGLMFQDFALFPHRTVAENIAFGLGMAGWDKARQLARVEEMLTLVALNGYGARTIFELSGGERQRVALARSLAPSPALLMLDEPLGSLDRGLRESLVEELRAILKEMGVTAVYVTHDQDEALALGDRIAVMRRGRIEQVDTPMQLYTHPANAFVARFMGFGNLLAAQRMNTATVATDLGPFPYSDALVQSGTLLIRPEAARLAPTLLHTEPGFHAHDADAHSVALIGTLAAATYHGSHFRIQVTAERTPGSAVALTFHLPTYQRDEKNHALVANRLPRVGDPICLLIYTDLASLLPDLA